MPAAIRFYRATGEHGYLSNLWPAPIVVDGVMFPDVERAYQFGKPSDPAVAAWILAAPTATLCAQAAHALFPWQVTKGWNDTKVERMERLLVVKFYQHDNLAAKLAATGDALLIEESTTDAFWGLGKKGTGKNMLGVLLMRVRERLQRKEVAG